MKKLTLLISIVVLAIPSLLFSQNIVYKPINPFFGGDTFNYQQLLASANAQNDFDGAEGDGFERATDIQNFTDNLNRQLLNSVSRDLFDNQFGDNQFSEGTYVFGSLVVEISPGSGGLIVNILDTGTGEQTQIIIPN